MARVKTSMWQITITDLTGKPIGARCKSFKDKAAALDYAKQLYEEEGRGGRRYSTYIEHV